MEYKTKTGVTLTVIQGGKGIELPRETKMQDLRDRCQSLHYTLESIRNSLADALTLKQLSKFQATYGKSDEVRVKSLPKRHQAAYLEAERVRVELCSLQAEYRNLRDQASTESEAI